MNGTKYHLPVQSFPRHHIGEADKRGSLLVVIDWQSLARQLGTKAAWSKGKRSRALSGAIVVTFTEAKK